MQFRIKLIDEYGYNGRENHPKQSDVGLVVTPIKLDTHFFSPQLVCESVLDKNGKLFEPAIPYLTGVEDVEGEHGIESCFTCVTADGRLLDLMDFELEAVGPV